MHRPFLFMSGEFAVSMPLVFATEAGPSPTDEVAAHMREVFKDRMDRVKSSART